jgi:hypothetical protein
MNPTKLYIKPKALTKTVQTLHSSQPKSWVSSSALGNRASVLSLLRKREPSKPNHSTRGHSGRGNIIQSILTMEKAKMHSIYSTNLDAVMAIADSKRSCSKQPNQIEAESRLTITTSAEGNNLEISGIKSTTAQYHENQ